MVCEVGAVGDQRVAGVLAVDADDKAESPCSAGLHAGDGVLEDDGVARRDSEQLRGVEEGVGRRFADKPELRRLDAGDLCVEELAQAGVLEDVAAVLAGRYDRSLGAVRASGPDEGDGVVEQLDVVPLKFFGEVAVLGIAERADGVLARRVLRRARGEVDAAGVQEGLHAVVASSAIDAAEVVGRYLERLERDSERVRAPCEERVEEALPRSGMDRGGAGDDAVEVEQQRLVGGEVDWRAAGSVPVTAWRGPPSCCGPVVCARGGLMARHRAGSFLGVGVAAAALG